MKRMILFFCLCLAATSVHAEGNWSVDKKTGCQAMLPYQVIPLGLTMTWSGECKDSKAVGRGAVKVSIKKEWIFTIEGVMKDGQCDQDCSKIDSIGNKYTGEMKNNAYHGKGTLSRADGTFSYTGEFQNGKFDGKGTFTFQDGAIYSGEWKQNKKNGTGQLTSVDGIYTGEFKDDSFNGIGTMTFSPVSKNYIEYKGEWENNDPHGTGTMIYKNGDKYSGSWSKGREHGKGVYTFKDGTSYEGLWEHGERIKIF